MSGYSKQYEFKKKPVKPSPIEKGDVPISDSKLKFAIGLRTIQKPYKMSPEVQAIFPVPLKWNELTERWEIQTTGTWANSTSDSNNYLNIHAVTVDQLPSSLSGSGNLTVDLAESEIKVPVDKQAIYRVQVIETTTALAASASFTSAGIDTTNYSNFQGFVYADVDGTLKLQMSPDNSNWYDYKSYSVTGGTPLAFDDAVVTPYMRVVYTNGSTDQSSFRLDAYTVVK